MEFDPKNRGKIKKTLLGPVECLINQIRKLETMMVIESSLLQ